MNTQLSFRIKIQLILLGLSVMTFGLFLFGAKETTQALRAGKEAQVHSSAEAMIDKIDRNLFERYGDVQAFALSDPARSLNAERITSFINDMMGTYAPIYDLMIVTDARGRVIAASTKNKKGESLHSRSLIGTDYSTRA